MSGQELRPEEAEELYWEARIEASIADALSRPRKTKHSFIDDGTFRRMCVCGETEVACRSK